MEEYVRLWVPPPPQRGDNFSFISNEEMRKYSNTYKILHGNMQPVFSSDSSSNTEDEADEKSENNRKKKSKNSSGFKRNKVVSNNCKFKNQKSKRIYGPEYVPCFIDENKIKYPKASCLNQEGQALYLKLMMKFTRNHSALPLRSEEKELQQYLNLHDKVLAENFEFIAFVKHRCAMTQDRYLLINSDIKKYIEEVWQHRLSRVSKYPAGYEPLRMLPIVYSDQNKPVVMTLEETLLEMGSIPIAFVPNFDRSVRVLTNYSWMVKINPPNCRLPGGDSGNVIYKTEVSDDKNAEKLAISSGADIVMSSSSLKCIVDNHSPAFDKSWDIPVIVRECKQQETGLSKKVVYINKPLPPRSLTVVEKNLWYHKYGVKTLICQRKNKNFFKLSESDINFISEESRNVTHEDTTERQNPVMSDAESWETMSDNCTQTELQDSENESNKKTVTPGNKFNRVNYSKRKHEDDFFNESESLDDDDDDNLVIDCSDSEITTKRGNKKKTGRSGNRSSLQSDVSSPDPGFGDNSEITTKRGNKKKTAHSGSRSSTQSDVSSLDPGFGNNSEITTKRGNKKKTAHSGSRSSPQSDVSSPDPGFGDGRITRSKARLIEKMSSINKTLGYKPIRFVASTEHGSVPCSEKKKGKQKTNLVKPFKNLKMSDVSESEIDTTMSVVTETSTTDVSSKRKVTNDRKSFGRTQQFGSKLKHVGYNTRQKLKSDVKNLPNVKGDVEDKVYIPPAPGCNVSYRLWKLKKSESQKEDLKGSFLKGDRSNREIKVLIRNKVDACEVKGKTKQTLCVFPKLEYQTEFGAECLTQSEIIRQWVSLFVRPGCNLCRVRIKASTSEVMMVQYCSLQDVAQEGIQQTGRSNSLVLGTLYNILVGLVDLNPGHYLLSHSPKLGAFVNLLQCVGKGRINLHDLYNVDPETDSVIQGSAWLAIDNTIITPFHKAFSRVPGTFPPLHAVEGKPLKRCGSKYWLKKRKNRKQRQRQRQKREKPKAKSN